MYWSSYCRFFVKLGYQNIKCSDEGLNGSETTIINMCIMQVNAGRRKMISQDKKMWLM